jgi:hypothetical protein
MFAPLGFVPGITPAQLEARRSAVAGVRPGSHRGALHEVGAWFAGPPEELTAYLKDLESRYPGLEYVNMSISMGTPQNRDESRQLNWFAKEVDACNFERAA